MNAGHVNGWLKPLMVQALRRAAMAGLLVLPAAISDLALSIVGSSIDGAEALT
jgi:hypothetical protein